MIEIKSRKIFACSALDARRQGFAVTVIVDACRAIDRDGSPDRALAAMRAASVVLAMHDAIR